MIDSFIDTMIIVAALIFLFSAFVSNGDVIRQIISAFLR